MIDPLNRANAPLIVRLFDVCFKRGVIDACELGDDYRAREFVRKHKESWTFGVVTDDVDYDWQMFRFTLYWWSRRSRVSGLTSLAENYILFVRKKNHLWPLLPFCMRFYLLGIEEWLAYPNPVQVQLFKSQKKLHWDPNGPNKTFTLPDYVSYLHEFTFDYTKLPEELQPINQSSLESFCEAIYTLTRKYVEKRYWHRKKQNT